jgi:hypothetical protein
MNVQDALPARIWYAPGLPCRKCGRQPWNAFQVATRAPEGWASSKEYSEEVAECGRELARFHKPVMT